VALRLRQPPFYLRAGYFRAGPRGSNSPRRAGGFPGPGGFRPGRTGGLGLVSPGRGRAGGRGDRPGRKRS